MPKTVTPSMPLKTAVPSATRISAPAPAARTRGTTPRMKANEVIRIGRRRCFEASTVASKRPRPWSCSCLANSTIRMAFLLARPTSTTSPIWVKMLLSMPASPDWGKLFLALAASAGPPGAPHRPRGADGGARPGHRPPRVRPRPHREADPPRQREAQLGEQVLARLDLLVGELGPLEAHA